jgi:hypothetical protein
LGDVASAISRRHCERSEATQELTRPLGCFVASLLAMTIQFDLDAAQACVSRPDFGPAPTDQMLAST